MKRLWICAALLLALLATTLLKSRYIDRTVRTLTDRLDQAYAEATADRWQRAAQLTEQARKLWQSRDVLFHILLPHRDIDAIRLSFREVEQYLSLEEPDQYNAANARLIEQLGLLAEMERLDLKNIL